MGSAVPQKERSRPLRTRMMHRNISGTRVWKSWVAYSLKALVMTTVPPSLNSRSGFSARARFTRESMACLASIWAMG